MSAKAGRPDGFGVPAPAGELATGGGAAAVADGLGADVPHPMSVSARMIDR
jgi:hypothetical protein